MIALMLLPLFVNCLYVVVEAKKYGRKSFAHTILYKRANTWGCHLLLVLY